MGSSLIPLDDSSTCWHVNAFVSGSAILRLKYLYMCIFLLVKKIPLNTICGWSEHPAPHVWVQWGVLVQEKRVGIAWVISNVSLADVCASRFARISSRFYRTRIRKEKKMKNIYHYLIISFIINLLIFIKLYNCFLYI